MTPIPKAQWWRWPLVPIASLFGATLGSAVIFFIFRLVTLFNGFDPDAWWPQFIENTFITCSFGIFCTSIAYTIAPKYKLYSAVGMLISCACSAAIFISSLMNREIFPKSYIIQLIICFFIALVTSFFATMHEHRK